LPQKAVVADIGAGLSRLGHEVVSFRPDVRWINIDPCYDNAAIKDGIEHDGEVEYLAEDIVKGSANLTKLTGKVDFVYSYWMLPHLSEESDEPVQKASSNMYDLLKPVGKLIVGPVKKLGFGFLSPYRYKGVKHYTKQQSKVEVVADIVRSTKLWWLPRKIQLFSNKYNIHFGALFVGGKQKTVQEKDI
jgi:hypothetical protein